MKNDKLIELINEIECLCYTDKREEAIKLINQMTEELLKRYGDEYNLTNSLNALISVLEAKDYVLTGDLLEYVIKPIINNQDFPVDLLNLDMYAIPDVPSTIFYLSTFTDELSLCVKQGNKKTVKMNSMVSPEHEAEVLFRTLKIKKNTPAVCLFGIGTGILPEIILNHLSENAKLVIYEPDNKIMDYCLQSAEEADCSESEQLIAKRIKKLQSDKRTKIFFVNNYSKTFGEFLSENFDYKDLMGLIFGISGNGYSLLYSKECLDFIREIEKLRRVTVTNRNVFSLFSNQYIEYIFKNLWVLRQMNLCKEIDNILPDTIPVIIVAAGPSLNKNIDILRQAKGHLLILAVDTALPILLAKNIIPDITITVDPEKITRLFSDTRSHEIPCIFDINSNPQIVEKHVGRRFVLIRNNYLSVLLDSIGRKIPLDQDGGGSVATVAFCVMHDLKQKKIILIGQDLASEDGKTHAGDVNIGDVGDITVEGIYGGTVTTRADWYNFLKWYEAAIETIKRAGIDIRIIDATEGGAKIHGTEIMTLQEAIDDCRDENGKLPNYDFNNELKKLDYFLSKEEYLELCSNHRKNISKLKLLQEDANEVVRICNNLLRGIEQGTVSDSYIDKQKKIIQKKHEYYLNSPWHSLINTYLSGVIIDSVSQLALSEGNKKNTQVKEITLLLISFEKIAYVVNKINENAKNYDYLLNIDD